MKRVISLFLAMLLLAVFAVSAAAVDSPVKPTPGGEVIPTNPGSNENPKPGIIQKPDGTLVLQNSKGEQTPRFHVILDSNGAQVFWHGNYEIELGEHIDGVEDPVIKLTLLSSASKANKKAESGDVTDTNIGFEKNQKLMDLYKSYMDILAKKGNAKDFVKSLGDTDAKGFTAALEAVNKADKAFTIADLFDISMNEAAYEFFAGETYVPFQFVVYENLTGSVGEKTVVGHLIKSVDLEYLLAPFAKSSAGIIGVQMEVNLMNLSPFMLFAEIKEGNPVVTDEDRDVTGTVLPTSPKTGDLGEPAPKANFPWMMVSVLLAAAAFCVYRSTKKEQ